MGLREKLRRLENAAKDHKVPARCSECGEEHLVDPHMQLDLVGLDWFGYHRDGQLPADTPSDVRWVFEHPHSASALIDIRTGEPVFRGVPRDMP